MSRKIKLIGASLDIIYGYQIYNNKELEGGPNDEEN